MAPPALLRRVYGSAVRTPGPVARALLGAPPVNDRGVALDLQTHILLSLGRATGRPPLDERGPEGARDEVNLLAKVLDLPPRPLYRVEDRWIEGPGDRLRLRIYVPRQAEVLPGLVYFHGGGFVVGGLESHDGALRLLAERAQAIVVAVDYRLAPEAPYPAAVDDADAAFQWTVQHAEALGIDVRRVAVGGDSAGGNLAAAVSRRRRDAGGPHPSFQYLVYPALDLTRREASHETFRSGFYLTAAMIDWFLANYLTDAQQKTEPDASPLLVDDLKGLPPAFIGTAGFDPLRDEGERYAERLRAAGVEVSHRSFDALIHGFLTTGGLLDGAARGVEELAEALRTGLGHRVAEDAHAQQPG
ncbi:MAG: alpha/beta hydrolase [Sandaracinaceae bacterium]